jgi:ribonuclease E
MSSKILINALDPEECRIAKVTDNRLSEFHVESAGRELTQGNIYKGIVNRVEPGLQSVFVDYGADKNGFLQRGEIHSDYFHDMESGKTSLKDLIKRGQALLVQVTKEPIRHKGAMLTTFISLPGRFLVLMPGSKNIGISRKIEDEKERIRLKDIVNGLTIPEGFGVIVRTAGVGANKTMLTKDFRNLMRLWKDINKRGVSAEAPALLHKEQNLALRTVRDHFSNDVTGILVDNETIYQEIQEFMGIISPQKKKIVKLHRSEKPIFSKYQLEDQIASIYENRVSLSSGGSVIIEQTEAMVSIDVNSGKGTHKSSIEQTAYRTNIEAAEEIARQLQLRDLGGLIVIDFIDMKDGKHKAEVVRTLKKWMKTDKAKSKVGHITQFGLLEMSRQRIRAAIDYANYITCVRCAGKGLIPAIETRALKFLRRLNIETAKNEIQMVRGVVPDDVAEYLLNRKRKEILDLEIRRDLQITIEGDPQMTPGDARIVCESKPV